MPIVIDHGNSLAQGLAAGLLGMAGAKLDERDRQDRLDAQAQDRQMRMQLANRELDVRQAGVEQDAEDARLRDLTEQRKVYASTGLGLLREGLFGAEDSPEAQNMAQLLMGVAKGEVDVGKVQPMIEQAQADYRRMEIPRQQRAAAVAEIGQFAAAMPHDPELQSILVDVQSGAMDPDEGRLHATIKAGNLGQTFERMVQSRAEQMVGGAGGASPIRLKSLDQPMPGMAEEIQTAASRGLLRPAAKVPKAQRESAVGALVQLQESGATPYDILQAALEQGLDPNDPGLLKEMRATAEAKAKATKEAEAKATADRPKAVDELRASLRQADWKGGDILGHARKIAKRLKLDLSDEELQVIIRQEGVGGIKAEFQ